MALAGHDLGQHVAVRAGVVAEGLEPGDGHHEDGAEHPEGREGDDAAHPPRHSSCSRILAIASSTSTGTTIAPMAICERATSGA